VQAVRIDIIYLLVVTACATSAEPLIAEDKKRFVERLPYPFIPDQHSHQSAGTCVSVHKWAIPGIGKHEAGGYVGGSGLIRGTAPGTVAGHFDGTFGWDYVGFGKRPGRVFLGFLYDRPHQTLFYPKYYADRKIKDVIAAQPFKRAVREAKIEKHEAGEGHHGHGVTPSGAGHE
jgi:hypothetical protein